MKKIIIIFLLHVSVFIYPQDIQIGAQSHEKLPICIGLIGKKSPELKNMAERIAQDLSFSGQFAPTVRMCGRKPSKDEVATIANEGFPLVVFLNYGKHKKGFEWRLYDTTQSLMLAGKTYTKRGDSWRGWAHNIADALWPMLTGEQSFFSSKLAYCKQTFAHNGKRLTRVCVADFDASNEQILINTPTINVAPRWNADTQKPLLFYSEYTNANVRLMAADMKGRRKVTSNFEGINMLPSFSHDGSQVIYCASRGDGNCQLYHYTKDSFKKLTHNDGNNIAPCLAHNGKTVFFCSDYQTGRPQIFQLDVATGKTKRLTKGGYCASPNYCEKRNQLAYGKIVGRDMQLFVYDFVTDTHRQLTSDPGNKEECSWSPCGNYVAFSVQKGETSDVAVFNVLTNTQHYLTKGTDSYSYPIWSPLYQTYPTIQA